MQHLITDLEILDDNDFSKVIENFVSELERLQIDGRISNQNKEDLIKKIIEIERLVQDLEELKTQSLNLTIGFVTNNLNRIIENIKLFLDPEKISKYIDELQSISEYLNDVKDKYVPNLEEWHVHLDNIESKTWLDLTKIHSDYFKFSLVTELKKANDDAKKIREIVKRYREDLNSTWDVQFFINHENDSDSLYALWALISSLEAIEGVKVEIEDIRKGSIWSKFRVFFSSKDAQKEAEALMDSAKKMLHGKMQTEHFQNEKNRSESEKIQAETEQIKFDLDSKNSEYEKEKKAEEIKAIKLDNEKKELELEQLKFKFKLERIDAYAKFVAENLIKSTETQIFINDILQIDKKADGTVEIGPELSSPEPE